MTGFAAAWRFLTRLPLPGTVRGDWADFSQALAWFPVVGVVIGVLLAFADAVLRQSFGSFTASVMVVALWLVLTGALHVDGLVDTCDAVFAAASPERRLEIMRDTRVGVFGVAALVVVLALKVAALVELPAEARGWALVAAPVVGRLALVLSATVFPYARAEGLGSPLRAAATPRGLIMPLAVVVVLCAAGGAWLLAVALLSSLGALLLGRWLHAKLQAGLTGDCYGAVCEIVETLVLVAAGPGMLVVGLGWRTW